MSLCHAVVKIRWFKLCWKWIDLISCKEFKILRLYLSGRLEYYNTKKIHLGFKWGIVISWIAGKSKKDRDNLICLLDLLFRTAWHQEIMSVCQGLQQVWILIIWWSCFQYFLVILVVSFFWDQQIAWNCCIFQGSTVTFPTTCQYGKYINFGNLLSTLKNYFPEEKRTALWTWSLVREKPKRKRLMIVDR